MGELGRSFYWAGWGLDLSHLSLLHLYHLISIFPPSLAPGMCHLPCFPYVSQLSTSLPGGLPSTFPTKPPSLPQASPTCLSFEVEHSQDQTHTVRHTL